MNLYVATGNLTRDVELRYTPGGKAVADFGFATSNSYKKGDEWVDDVTFLDCEIWAEQAERLAQQAEKGTKVLIEGKLKLESWEKDGQKRSKIVVRVNRVEILARKKESADADEKKEEAPVVGSVDDIGF